MNVTIIPALLKGAVTPPPSKSHAHRLIIAAALSYCVCKLSNVELSEDIRCHSAVYAYVGCDAPR